MAKRAKSTTNVKCVPSVRKAFDIMELLTSHNDSFTISEISRTFRIPISTANNLLTSLVVCGYAVRDAKGRFRSTMKLLLEASKLVDKLDIRDVAHPELEQLSLETTLSASLSVREENHVVCIDKVEGASQIRVASRIGGQFHLHATATGKVLMSHLPEEEINAICAATGLPAVTPNTITALPVLKKELQRVRAQGYALDDGENVVGIRGVAAPIFDHQGFVVGALSTGGVGFQLNDNLKKITACVKSTTEAVSEKLGYRASVVTPVNSSLLRSSLR
jgi:IclR family transcriptional regulator, KDG regulon repressor